MIGIRQCLIGVRRIVSPTIFGSTRGCIRFRSVERSLTGDKVGITNRRLVACPTGGEQDVCHIIECLHERHTIGGGDGIRTCPSGGVSDRTDGAYIDVILRLCRKPVDGKHGGIDRLNRCFSAQHKSCRTIRILPLRSLIIGYKGECSRSGSSRFERTFFHTKANR